MADIFIFGAWWSNIFYFCGICDLLRCFNYVYAGVLVSYIAVIPASLSYMKYQRPCMDGMLFSLLLYWKNVNLNAPSTLLNICKYYYISSISLFLWNTFLKWYSESSQIAILDLLTNFRIAILHHLAGNNFNVGFCCCCWSYYF